MIEFVDKTHEYFLDGRRIPSVSELLQAVFPQRFGMPGANAEVLRAGAEYGTIIHEAVQKWLETGEKADFVELDNFIRLWTDASLELIECERMVYTEDFAGRLDIKAKDSQGKVWILDIKTTSQKKLVNVQYQTSLYKFADDASGTTESADRLGIVWLHNEDCAFNEVQYKGDEWCDKVIEAYYNNETMPECEELIISQDLTLVAQKYWEAYQEANAYLENFRETLLKLMQEQGKSKVDFGNFTASLRAGGTRKSFDSKKFKEEHPELAKQYEKESTTAPSVVLKAKGGKDE